MNITLATSLTHLLVVIDAFKENSPGTRPNCGHRGLPKRARVHTNTIGLFYDDLAKLVAYGMIDQGLVIGAYGTNIVRLWDALAPYVYTGRRVHGLHFWIFFEDLAARTAATPPEVVYAGLRLRSRPPSPRGEPGAVEAGDDPVRNREAPGSGRG